MLSELSILFKLALRDTLEVHGRSGASVPPDREELPGLRRFIRGECSHEERTEVCRFLRKKPELLAWVAEQVKEERKACE